MLKIHGLKKKFGNFEALRGLDMEVEEGAEINRAYNIFYLFFLLS